MASKIRRFEASVKPGVAANEFHLDKCEDQVLKLFDEWRQEIATRTYHIFGVQWRRVRGPSRDAADGRWYVELEVLYEFVYSHLGA